MAFLWKLTRDAVFAALEMYHKEQEYILRQLYAELALWIFVWFVAKTSLWYHGNQGQVFGRVVDCYSYTLTTCLLQLSL